MVTAALVLPTSLLALGLIVLGDSSARAISNSLAQEAVEADRSALETSLRSYLADAEQMSDVFQRLVQIGELDPMNLPEWRPATLQYIAAFDEIASISFGRPDGATFWVAEIGDGYEYAIKEPGGFMREYAIEPHAPERIELVQEYAYDVLERPWYQAAMEAGGPVWSDIYAWAGKDGGDGESGMSYARPMTDENGAFIGVLGVDISLGAASERVRSLSALGDRYIQLVDDTGRLVASSEASVTDDEGQRLSAPAAAERDRAVFSATALGTQTGTLRGERARFSILPITPGPGLDWRVIIGIPESVFLADAQATRRRLIAISSLGALVMLAAGLLIASMIVVKFHKIRDHAAALGAGRFEVRLPETGLPEWRDLAFEINGIAEKLGQSEQPDLGAARPVLSEGADMHTEPSEGVAPSERGTPTPRSRAETSEPIPTVVCVRFNELLPNGNRPSMTFEDMLREFETIASESQMRVIPCVGTMLLCVRDADDSDSSQAATIAVQAALRMLGAARAHGDDGCGVCISIASGALKTRARGAGGQDHVYGAPIDLLRSLCEHAPLGTIQVHASTQHLLGPSFAMTERGRFLTASGEIEHLFTLTM